MQKRYLPTLLVTQDFAFVFLPVLSRSNSDGSLDETKALLSEEDQRPKDGQLELHMTSSSSDGSRQESLMTEMKEKT